MENLIKKFFYTGVGLISMTAERLQKTVDEMVGEGKVSEEEGKKIVDSFIDDVEKRRGEFENNMKETIDNFTSNVNTPEFLKHNFFTEMNERLEAIEQRLGIQHEPKSATSVQEVVDAAAETAKDKVEEANDKAEEALENAKSTAKSSTAKAPAKRATKKTTK